MKVASNAPVAACDAVTERAGMGVLHHRERTLAFSNVALKVPGRTEPVASILSPTLTGWPHVCLIKMPPVASCAKRAGEVRTTMPRMVAVCGRAIGKSFRLLMG